MKGRDLGAAIRVSLSMTAAARQQARTVRNDRHRMPLDPPEPEPTSHRLGPLWNFRDVELRRPAVHMPRLQELRKVPAVRVSYTSAARACRAPVQV